MKQQVCILMKNSEFITFFSAVLLSSNVWIASVATLLYWYSIVETYKLGISKNRAEVSDIDSAQKVGIGPIGTTLIFLYMRTAVLWSFPVLVLVPVLDKFLFSFSFSSTFEQSKIIAPVINSAHTGLFSFSIGNWNNTKLVVVLITQPWKYSANIE